MAKIGCEVIEDLPDLEAGKIYKVTSAEVGETEKEHYPAVTLLCESVPKGVAHSTMLWIQKKVGEHTKLGAFIAVLGNDTDKWTGKVFEVVSWIEKNREIKLAK